MAKTVTPQYDNLPTAEEYKSAKAKPTPMLEYREAKYRCSKCDGAMCRHSMYALPTIPVQYEYKCNKCGCVEYLTY